MKKPNRVGISIDMTPFVDIAFLLLIFFMATTVFKPPEEEVILLPESHSEAKAPEAGVITISVSKGSVVHVIWRQQGQEIDHLADSADLRNDLSLALRNARSANPSARVIVKMDKEAPYGVMADMMSALQEAKAPRFNVQTELAADAGAFRPGQNP